MGLFGYLYTPQKPIQELTVGDQKIEDDEDFSVDKEQDENPDDTDTGDDQTADDTNDDGTDNTDSSDTGDDTTDDDYSLPDDTGDDGQTDDTADNTDGDNQDTADDTDTGDDQTSDDTTDDGGDDTDNTDDDFSMDDGGGGDDSGADDGSSDTGDDTDTTDGDTADAGNPATDDGTAEDDQAGVQAEDQLYDTLSDDQKKIRILQLKLNYRDLYNETDLIMNGINNITKTDTNTDAIYRVVDTIQSIRQCLIDYIENVFDRSTYLSNNEIYIKYISIFRTIKKTIDELSNDQKNTN